MRRSEKPPTIGTEDAGRVTMEGAAVFGDSRHQAEGISSPEPSSFCDIYGVCNIQLCEVDPGQEVLQCGWEATVGHLMGPD